MSESLLSAVTRFLSPEMIGKMASASGLDASMTQKAVNASVPAILGSLSQVASQPGGARQLANAIAEQPAGILGSLAGALGGSAQLADKGNSLLSSLLGGGLLNGIASAVAKHIGIGEGPARTLIGLLSPVIMGVMGRQQRAAGLDANGLARMLSGQKDEIAAALPAGLASLLPSDLHESFEMPRTMEQRPYDFPRSAYNSPRAPDAPVQRMVSEPPTESTRATWPYWLLPLLAIGGLLWYLMPTDHSVQRTSEPARTTTNSQPASLLTGGTGAAARSSFLTKVADGSISVETYTGQDVYNRNGERLGTVKDLFIGPDGKIHAAILSVGSFLGIGEKQVAVPFNAVLVENRNGDLRLTIDAAKEALHAAPVFKQDRPDGYKMIAPVQRSAPPSNGASGQTKP